MNNGNLTEKAAIKSPHAHRLTERVAALNKSCESTVQSRVQSSPVQSPGIVETRPDLRKATFHAHNIKTHFSPLNDSCTR